MNTFVTCTLTELTPDSFDDLVGHMSDFSHRKRLKVVLLEEFICTETQQLEDDANMAMVVEPVQHPHTGTSVKAQKGYKCKWTSTKEATL